MSALLHAFFLDAVRRDPDHVAIDAPRSRTGTQFTGSIGFVEVAVLSRDETLFEQNIIKGRLLGNKVSARELAQKMNVPVMPATGALPRDPAEAAKLAAQVGYPLMLKASWGGGGRGMRVIESEADLPGLMEVAQREALAAFGNDEVYLEKLVRRARHVEVQVLGDTHGGLIHLFERDCSVQRRNQKVVERAPALYLDDERRVELCAAALKLGRRVDYTHAGTVEFLMDADSGAFYFIEVNPRIQVEHTVTEVITGLDLVRAQILIAQGHALHSPEVGMPRQEDVPRNGYAIQARVTTEDPANKFIPDYGRIIAYRSPGGFGIRLDGGMGYSGSVITPFYDSMLVKVIASGQSYEIAMNRMDRALSEFRIEGAPTNIAFLQSLLADPDFLAGELSTAFLDEHPQLLAGTPGAQLVDVRSSGEFTEGHLAGAANMNINDDGYKDKFNTLDKNKPVFVYCLSGGRSGRAANIM